MAEYDELVEKYQIYENNELYIKIDRNSDTLLVSLATLQNKGKYSGLPTFFEHLSCDLLFFTDTDNTYYLRNDGGVQFKNQISKLLESYDPEKIIFFGASMAGYAAIDLAISFNANAIVNNPQINLDITMKTAWRGLKEIIEVIPIKRNIEEKNIKSSNSTICILFGNHPMDIANADIFFNMFVHTAGLSVISGRSFDSEHKYYFKGITAFKRMFDTVLMMRQFMGNIHKQFPENLDQLQKE